MDVCTCGIELQNHLDALTRELTEGRDARAAEGHLEHLDRVAPRLATLDLWVLAGELWSSEGERDRAVACIDRARGALGHAGLDPDRMNREWSLLSQAYARFGALEKCTTISAEWTIFLMQCKPLPFEHVRTALRALADAAREGPPELPSAMNQLVTALSALENGDVALADSQIEAVLAVPDTRGLQVASALTTALYATTLDASERFRWLCKLDRVYPKLGTIPRSVIANNRAALVREYRNRGERLRAAQLICELPIADLDATQAEEAANDAQHVGYWAYREANYLLAGPVLEVAAELGLRLGKPLEQVGIALNHAAGARRKAGADTSQCLALALRAADIFASLAQSRPHDPLAKLQAGMNYAAAGRLGRETSDPRTRSWLEKGASFHAAALATGELDDARRKLAEEELASVADVQRHLET